MHSRIQHEIEPSCVLPVFIWHVKDFGAARDGDATLLSNDSVYARIGTVDSGENRIGKSFKMAALYQKRVDTFPKLG